MDSSSQAMRIAQCDPTSPAAVRVSKRNYAALQKLQTDAELESWSSFHCRIRSNFGLNHDKNCPSEKPHVSQRNGISPFRTIKREIRITEAAESAGAQLFLSGDKFKSLCPLHSEKTPSFFLYPQTDSFFCFGCGKGGDVIDLLELTGQLPEFMEAVRGR